jgi:hypothetical protein
MASTRTQVLFYGRSQYIEADGCYSIAFFRPTAGNNAQVTAPVQVNGVPIEAGQTLTIEQNVGDIDTSSYEIVFYNDGTQVNEMFVIKIMPVDMTANAATPKLY